MWVFDRVECPAAPVCNLNTEYFQHEVQCEVGPNGNEEIKKKSSLSWGLY